MTIESLLSHKCDYAHLPMIMMILVWEWWLGKNKWKASSTIELSLMTVVALWMLAVKLKGKIYERGIKSSS